MQIKTQLNDTWLKASILGSSWAASEIVLGSFLHNLRIPFNGNILTAIGLILMISAAYKWKDKGLFWRSGLICALMKTMSPSAVIFGPMIAIFMEALLFEISVRIIGRNMSGFMLGSALAMSWILVQKIINFILFYGFNIVEIYTQLMKYAERQFDFKFSLVWMPILFLLIIYIFSGLIAAFIGIRTGQKLISTQPTEFSNSKGKSYDYFKVKTDSFSYSIIWLISDFAVLVGMLFLINISIIYVWMSATVIVIFIWAYRYKRGLGQLAKVKFWIFFVLITMVTAFTITFIQEGEGSLLNGLVIGLKMNFRAAVVIVGFSVIGTELYSPKIRDFFSKTSFRQLPVALELAFESLPKIIGDMPDLKTIIKNPVLVIHGMLFAADQRFNEFRKKDKTKVFIVSGELDSGKTTFIKSLLKLLQVEKIKTSGVYAEKLFKNGYFKGYNLVNISSIEKAFFLDASKDENHSLPINSFNEPHVNCEGNHKSKFEIVTDAYEKGVIWLKEAKDSVSDLIIIDEIGKWELNDLVWANSLTDLLSNSNKNLLLVVRDTNVEDVIKKWGINDPVIIDIKKENAESASRKIIRYVELK